VLGSLLPHRSGRKHLLLVGALFRVNRGDARLSERDGSRLVEDDRVHRAQRLEAEPTLDDRAGRAALPTAPRMASGVPSSLQHPMDRS
jgi:hypothetical protein